MELVKEFDVDKDEEISIYEFPSLMAKFGVKCTPEDMYDIFRDADEDGSLKIGTDEFETLLWDGWFENRTVSDTDKIVKLSLELQLEDIRKSKSRERWYECQGRRYCRFTEMVGCNIENYVR
eukprot:UN29416